MDFMIHQYVHQYAGNFVYFVFELAVLRITKIFSRDRALISDFDVHNSPDPGIN